MKFSAVIPSDPSEEDLLFVRQLGVECVYTWLQPEQMSLQYLLHLRNRVEKAGLTLYNAGCMDVAKSDKIHLALPGREEKIEQFQTFIRNLGKAGINTTTFTWEPTRVWSSKENVIRGAKTRSVDLEEMMRRPYTHGREYSREEIWNNFAYFIKRIIPVAEEAGVRLALHPNDPPAPSYGGIPCLIYRNADYQRAFDLADSDFLGMEFCAGCWLEGGNQFGNLIEAIRYYAKRNKIFIVHFRNVSSPLPKFVETFLDNGYMDMYKIMKALRESDYQGTITLDHTPQFEPSMGQGSGTAYAIGYMRALRERAEEEY